MKLTQNDKIFAISFIAICLTLWALGAAAAAWLFKRLFLPMIVSYGIVTAATTQIPVDNQGACCHNWRWEWKNCQGSARSQNIGAICSGNGTKPFDDSGLTTYPESMSCATDFTMRDMSNGDPAVGAFANFANAVAGGFTINAGCTASTNQICSISNRMERWTFNNTSTDFQAYQAFHGENAICGAFLFLDPGQNGSVIVNTAYDDCAGVGSAPTTTLKMGNSSQFEVSQDCITLTFPHGSQNLGHGNPTVVLGGSGSFEPGTKEGPFTGPPSTGTNVFNAGNSTNGVPGNTNQNIGYSSTNTGSADNVTLKEGFNTLHNDLVSGFGAANAHLGKLEQNTLSTANGIAQLTNFITGNKPIWDTNGINQLRNDITNGLGRLGSLLGTNVAGGGISDSNSINSFHTDNTNLLGQLIGQMRGTNMGLGGLGTNYDSAKAIGQGVADDFKDAQEGIRDAIATPDFGIGGGGTPTVMMIGDRELEMDLMPGEFSQMWSMMYNLALWGLYAYYLKRVAKDAYDLVVLLGTTRGYDIPDIQGTVLGVGGNWGAAIAPAMLLAVITVFGVALGAVGVSFAGIATEATAVVSANPLAGATGAVANGFAYLLRAFPLAIAVALSCSYTVFLYTKNIIASGAVIVIRAILGA